MRKLIPFFLLLIFNYQFLLAEIRFVSHSGSNTPPYTSWETAADSIMSAINISAFGDTIYVGNGVYYERVTMIPGLSLFGAGMDSCVINSSAISIPPGTYGLKITDSCKVSGFKILPSDNMQGIGIYIYDLNVSNISMILENVQVSNADYGVKITSSINFDSSYKLIKSNIITNVQAGFHSSQTSPTIIDNIIYPKVYGLGSDILSAPTYLGNTIIMQNAANNSHGLGSGFDLGSIVKNNLFISLDNTGEAAMYSYSDSLINNVAYGRWEYGIFTAGSDIRNNHIENCGTGLRYDVGGGQAPIFHYNNLWNNQFDYQSFSGDSTNIYSNPMFENPDSMDFHLQMYSPLIDAGDNAILDLDGSRSDIGLFGGPYGEKYLYRDIPPRSPVNLSATVDSDYILLKWNKNTEADFNHYNLYRDTTENFTADSTTFVASVEDTFYTHIRPEGINNLYFKLTAEDNQGNSSDPSEELHLVLTGTMKNEEFTIDNYKLFQNYPNPFNPSTIIGYRLKEKAYVKLYVYDLKGELLQTLVNQFQEGGYYEVEFNASDSKGLSSGIYLFQILMRNEHNIPVFTDIKKMVFIK